MRIPAMLLAAAAALMTTGCTSLFSLNPAVTGKEAVTDATLAGTWQAEGDTDIVTIQQGQDREYEIAFRSEKDPPLKFRGDLMRVGDAAILDLNAKADAPFTIAPHFFVRVWPEGNTMRWAWLQTDWLKKQAAALPSQEIDKDTLLLTAPSAAVGQFLRTNGVDPRAHDEVTIFQRLK